MCDPWTIAGIVLTGASTVTNTIAQSKVAKARDQALAAERIRQQGYDQEAGALNTQSQDRFGDFDNEQQARATKLGDYFAAQKIEQGNEDTQAVLEQNTAPTSSNLTVREEAKQRGNATDFANKQGAALGNLRAFGDLLGEKSMQNARDFGARGAKLPGSARCGPCSIGRPSAFHLAMPPSSNAASAPASRSTHQARHEVWCGPLS